MTDQEIGRIIEDFPFYEVTNHGRVFNTYSGRELILSPTVAGDLTVGLMRNQRQYRRAVKGLVARAFVDGETDVFNTPIQLDGNKHNLHASNIQWRPRWFAWDYTRQLTHVPEWAHGQPVLDVSNRLTYPSIYEAAITNGLLFEDIRRSILNERRVFPSGELYVYFE